MPNTLKPLPNAVLLLADGTVFSGYGLGKPGSTAGEICFNTAMTGYQEILTDPSYAGQIITFTTPHIGNVGANDEDHESPAPYAAGLIIREPITDASNFRSHAHLNEWLKQHSLRGISGIDTRALTRHIRDHGAQNVAIVFHETYDAAQLLRKAQETLTVAPDMHGLELAAHVTTRENYTWGEGRWSLYPPPIGGRSGGGRSLAQTERALTNNRPDSPNVNDAPLLNTPLLGEELAPHVVAIDYGAKHNILRSLVSAGCRLTVVPATATAEEILALKPDGVFLSNGPGDPAATAQYALPTIKKLIDADLPIFGICLGHQLLGLALGARTEKMSRGHRGANHPVKDFSTGKVEITSQNHGFAISDEGLPADINVTHRSLFDHTIQGIRHRSKPIFSVQGHPEASPGPHDSHYLFARFVAMMKPQKKAA